MHFIRSLLCQLLLTRRLSAGLRLLFAFSSFPNLKPTTTLLRGALGRLHRDLQHAVAESRVRVLGIDTFGQRNLAIEAAVGALRAVVVLLVLLALTLALAANHERFVREVNINVVFGQAGQVCAHDELTLAL